MLGMTRTLQPEFGHARLEGGRFEAKAVSGTAAATNAPPTSPSTPRMCSFYVDEFRVPACRGGRVGNGDAGVARRPNHGPPTTFRSSRMPPGHDIAPAPRTSTCDGIDARPNAFENPRRSARPAGGCPRSPAQRRQRNGKHVQPVVEIFPERAVGYGAPNCDGSRRSPDVESAAGSSARWFSSST
jgi:hypothetical protein